MSPMISMEAALNPNGDTEVMLYVVLSLIGLCLEFTALNKTYNWTMGWLRKRAGGNDAHLPSRTQGVVGAVWGGVFVLFGLFVIVPFTAPFGIIWTLLAGIFTVLDIYQVFIKRYVRARPGGPAPAGPAGEPEGRRDDERRGVLGKTTEDFRGAVIV